MSEEKLLLKFERIGSADGYEVTGYYYAGNPCWYIKVWPETHDVAEHCYEVTTGQFNPNTIAPEEREAVLKLLTRWESEKPKPPGGDVT